MLARQIQQPVREIVYRTRGHTHGPITRLMSPSDLGEILKPFVFLDLAGFDGRFAPMPMGFGWHPHSGIATVTVMLEGAVRYAAQGRARRGSGAGDPRGVWRCEEPDRGATDELPLRELEGRRALDVPPSQRTHGGVGRRARGRASDLLAHSERGNRNLRAHGGVD